MNLTESDKKMVMTYFNTFDNPQKLRQAFRNRNAEHLINNDDKVTIPDEWKNEIPVNSVHVRIYTYFSEKTLVVTGDTYTFKPKERIVTTNDPYLEKQYVSTQMFHSEDGEFTNYDQTTEDILTEVQEGYSD